MKRRVLMRIGGKPMPVPRCVDVQLQHGRAGDLMGLQGLPLSGDPARFRKIEKHELAGDISRCRT